ncbi:MliC family protein [Psychrobacter sp. I-STPA10]|uniref:MliC family protein n=1 Tax=Psychrobacter sp. I-STPA10 TaxID=2585769 RepID=UPI001E3498DE|nr:MliC family protein [Psychrobacter sp. I-STPA10]
MFSFTTSKTKVRLFSPLCATLLVPCLMLSACQKNDATQTANTTEPNQEVEAHDHDHEEHDHDHEGHDHDHEGHDHDHEGHDHDHEGHDHDHEGHDHDHEGHHHHGAHDPANMTKFSCEPENEIFAHYHNDEQPKIVHLLIDGVEYELSETPSTSGTLYSSDIGLTDDQGIAWKVTSEDKTQLSSFAVNGGQATDGKVLFECKKDS